MSNVHFYRDKDRHIVIANLAKKKARWFDRIATLTLACIIGWCFVGLVWMALNFQ